MKGFPQAFLFARFKKRTMLDLLGKGDKKHTALYAKGRLTETTIEGAGNFCLFHCYCLCRGHPSLII